MKKISELFDIIVAKSGGVDNYDPGPVPFITSSESKNGVVAYVQPELDDRVFEGPALVVSGLGFATVQLGKFLPKGNGGDSLTVLKPKNPMTVKSLVSIAASFNVLHQWRMGFGRKASKKRIEDLSVPYPATDIDSIWDTAKLSLSKLSTHLDLKLQTSASSFSDDEVERAMSKKDKELIAASELLDAAKVN
jgi:hypothetical protein